MRYIRERLPLFNYYLLIILHLTLLVKAVVIDEEPPACHKVHDVGNLADTATVKEINDKLQELYKEIETDAEFEENCTYWVQSGEGKEFIVTELLEWFEYRRDNYQSGLWGYCGKEGAADLIKGISALKKKAMEEKASGNPIIICNRDHLLNCHHKYLKCQCLTDSRTFRSIESEWWDNEGESKGDSEKDIFENQCVLSAGSDCPINAIFHCAPGTNCLFKDTLKPCVVGHHLKETMSKSMAASHRSKGRALPKGKQRKAASSSGAEANGGRASGAEKNRTNEARQGHQHEPYSMTRNDYPSMHCQCFGYEPKLYNTTKRAETDSSHSKNAGLGTLAIGLAFIFAIPLFNQA